MKLEYVVQKMCMWTDRWRYKHDIDKQTHRNTQHNFIKSGETLKTLALDTSVLGVRHFSAYIQSVQKTLSGQIGPTKVVPKCLGSELSWVRSVWFPCSQPQESQADNRRP